MPAGAVGEKNVVQVRIFRVSAQVCKVAGLRVQLDWGRSRIFNRFNGLYKGEIIAPKHVQPSVADVWRVWGRLSPLYNTH